MRCRNGACGGWFGGRRSGGVWGWGAGEWMYHVRWARGGVMRMVKVVDGRWEYLRAEGFGRDVPVTWESMCYPARAWLASPLQTGEAQRRWPVQFRAGTMSKLGPVGWSTGTAVDFEAWVEEMKRPKHVYY